ncbi:MAG: hypothetical protein EA355_01305 [Rhodobacteraceae bacterium]|nr:MAG: hypothetical protein EA355_01305 [Paracoccaceae bacterium]
MTLGWLTVLGAALALAGVGLLVRIALGARALARSSADAAATRAALRRFAALNAAAVGLAFLGLAVMILGALF